MNTQTGKVETSIAQTIENGPNTNASAPVYISEYNPHTGGDWNSAYNTSTIDDASEATDLGHQILYQLTGSNRPDRHYVFKFSQDSSTQPSGVVKGGLLNGENDAAPYDIGDSTRGGEVFTMLARKMAGSKKSYGWTGKGRTNTLQAVGATDDANNYYLYVTNGLTTDAFLTVDLHSWTVAAGNPVIINVVGPEHMYEVGAVPTVDANKNFTYQQAQNSVIQVVVPKTASQVLNTSYPPSNDATIRAGTNSGSNYGSLDTISAGFDTGTVSADNTYAIFMSFSGVSTTNMHAAILTLTVRSAGSNSRNVFTVLGMNSGSWTQGAITWSNAPNIKALSTPVTAIHQNIIDWTTNPPDIAGHITVPASAGAGYTVNVDVTDYVRGIGASPGFIIHRPFRRNAAGDISSPAQTYADVITNSLVSFESLESATVTSRPKLTVYYH